MRRRLQDPDLSPDGQSIVAVREHGGTSRDRRDADCRKLRRVRYPGASAMTDTIADSADAIQRARWSPDGRLIAVERRQPGVLPDVVIIDPDDGQRAVDDCRCSRAHRHAGMECVTGRAVIAAADFDGEPFDLYEFSLSVPSAALRLTRTSGALWPDVAPDGRTLVFAGYDVEGYDLYTQPYAALGEPPRPLSAPGTTALDAIPTATGQSRSYSPFAELVANLVESARLLGFGPDPVGAGDRRPDVLARHAYGLNATWLVDGPEVVRPLPRGTPDWSAAYAYTRWRPSIFDVGVPRDGVPRGQRRSGVTQRACRRRPARSAGRALRSGGARPS